MAREGLPPHRRGETGPLGSNNAMADTDTSAEHHAVKKDEQKRMKPDGPVPARDKPKGRRPDVHRRDSD